MEYRQKYIRTKDSDEFIFFPESIDHSQFADFNPISAGFCKIYDDEVLCFGESFILNIKSKDDDSALATKQIFGVEAMLKHLKL